MRRYTQTTLRRRTRTFLVCVLCVLTALTGRLAYIQLIQGPRLQLLAAEQWYRDLPLGAKRGNILDTNGKIMAESALTYSIYVRPVAVTDAARVSEVLSSYLSLNYETLHQKVSNRKVSEWLIKMQVPKSTALKIVAHNLDGVLIAQTYQRTYPLGTTGGQVLGLVSVDNAGQEGIEAYYDTVLRGTDGRLATSADLRGIPREDGVEYYAPATDGLDLQLHVDSVIQNILQTVLASAYYAQGAKAVSGLVFDCETGGIVASASAPFYDMNDQPRNDVSTLISQIKNTPITNVLEPGSTFKIITLAAAMEEGLTDENDTFNCPGFRMIDGERVKCWRTKGHGTQTLGEAVQNSCNCCFMDLALRLGVDKYYAYLQKFGVGRKTGVDFYGESSGLVLDKKYVRNVDLARIGFGQAIAVSPIQFQSIISAIVSDGVLKTPRLAKEIPGASSTVTSVTRAKIISPETSARMRNLLYGVVTNGSGRHAGVTGYQIGGKTGTAQKYKNGIIDQGKYISSFIGFLTVNGKAKYTVSLMVDEPSRNGYYGSIVAAPYVGQIFDGIIDYLKIPTDPNYVAPKKNPYAPPNPYPSDPDPYLVTLPSIAGLPLVDALTKLTNLGFFIDVDGEGLNATGTFPAAGSNLKYGEPIVIFTS